MKRKGKIPGRYHKTLKEQVRENPRLAAVYVILRVLVVLALVAQVFNGNFENVFLCVLTLILFSIPSFIERTVRIDIPDTLEVIILLFIFYHFDMKAYRKDIAAGLKPDISKPGTEVKIRGSHNLIFIIMIVIAVILSGTLPSMPMFQDAAGTVLGIHVFGEVTLSYPAIIECVIILVSAFLSFKTTDGSIRRENHFTWGAIHEVAVLFVGIFITMQPALMILKANGAELGITEPFEMFWATGLLSSFLDNTPTYLVFLTTAGALGLSQGMVTALGTVPVKMLEAISCGAVFMGANTYIGNAPNFMVKSIADENGIRMPSFFGYLIWSFGILVPVFIVDTLVFFL